MSAAFQERFDRDELKRMISLLCLNSAFPTLLLWYERIVYNTDLKGYLAFAHDLARVGLLPPDTLNRSWTIWEELYKNARPGANFGYEAQAYVIFIIPVIFFAWFLRRHAETAGRKALYGFLLALSLSGLFTSLSRTGIFTLAACLFLGVKGGRKFLYLGLGAAVVMALVALFPDNYFLARYTMRSADAYPFAAKLLQIARGFEGVLTDPVALLLGNPNLVNKEMGGFNPHNQFIYDMMTKGMAALFAGIGIFAAAFAAIRRYVPRAMGDGDQEGLDLSKAIWLSFMAVFINCLSTQALINSNTAIMLWIALFFLLQLAPEPRLYKVSLK